MGTWNFEILAEDFNAGSPSSFTVRMKYLFAFQFWYWKVCVKTRWGEWGRGRGRKHCFVNFCSLALLYLSMGEGLWVGQKVLFRASWNLNFFSRDLTGHNKHDSFWVVALTEYFYILLLWTIVISDCLPLEIHKHLPLPFPSIIFTANRQADNHFYKYIYLFLLLQ